MRLLNSSRRTLQEMLIGLRALPAALRRTSARASPALLLLVAILVLLLDVLQPAARADSNSQPESGRTGDLEMLVRAGFGEVTVVGIGVWVPFRIVLRNNGEAVSGKLIVSASAARNQQSREFVEEVNLPAHSIQLHEITAFLSSTGEDPVVRLVSNRGSGNDVLVETPVKIDRQYTFFNPRVDIAVVDTDQTALNGITSAEISRSPGREPFRKGSNAQQSTAAPPPALLSPQQSGRGGGRGAGFFNQQPRTAQPSVIQPDELPRDVVSYDTLSAVVIGDAPLGQLSPEQSRALKLWVAGGGLLIITGGADFAGLRAIGLDSILPVDPLGLTTLSSLPDLTDVYGKFEGNDPLVSMLARLRPGAQALIGAPGQVLVAERSYCAGRVRFVAINPKLNQYRGWSAAKDLWSDLLLPATESRAASYLTIGTAGPNRGRPGWGGLSSFLYNLAQIKPPSAKYFLLFLAAYIITVGPINYFSLRWKRKLDLAWLTIPLVVFLFTAVSVTIAQVSRGGEFVSADAATVDLYQPEGVARVTGSLLIMPPSKRVQELRFDDPGAYVSDAPTAAASDPIEFERGAQGQTIRVPMSTWTSKVFQSRAITDGAPQLIGFASADPAANKISVKNLSAAPITRAFLLAPAGVSTLFDLAPGEDREIQLDSPQSVGLLDWYQTQLPDSDETTLLADGWPLLERGLGAAGGLSQPWFTTGPNLPDLVKSLRRPILIGFGDGSQIRFGFQGPIKRRSKTLYLVHL
jgi:hypothetical protein